MINNLGVMECFDLLIICSFSSIWTEVIELTWDDKISPHHGIIQLYMAWEAYSLPCSFVCVLLVMYPIVAHKLSLSLPQFKHVNSIG